MLSLSLVQTVPLPPVDHSRLPVILSRFLLTSRASRKREKERGKEREMLDRENNRSKGCGEERTAEEERNNDRPHSLLLSLASRG